MIHESVFGSALGEDLVMGVVFDEGTNICTVASFDVITYFKNTSEVDPAALAAYFEDADWANMTAPKGTLSIRIFELIF